MKNYIKNTFSGFGDSFRFVQGNARVTVLTQVFWAIPYSLYSPFLSLYMNRLGCSMEQIGLISTIGMLFGAVVMLFAGWITDRLGRKRMNLYADMLCWVLPCLIWGLSGSFAWFVLAGAINAVVRFVSVGWNCILMEDTLPENRLTTYWWVGSVITASLFFTPLMSLFIDHIGLVDAMRWVLVASAIVQAAALLIRNRMYTETAIGLERMRMSKTESPFALLRVYTTLFMSFKSNPKLPLIIAMRTLYIVQIGLRSTYLPITVVKGLEFSDGVVGVLSLVSGAVTLLAQFLLMPKLKAFPKGKSLFYSLIIVAAGSAMLALSPAKSAIVLVAGTVLSAGGALMAGMLMDTSIANVTSDADRASLLALMMILMVALSAPFMWLGGLLAGLPGIGPRLPMWLAAALIVLSIAMMGYKGRLSGEKQDEETVRVA